jgi:hypothetical protein
MPDPATPPAANSDPATPPAATPPASTDPKGGQPPAATPPAPNSDQPLQLTKEQLEAAFQHPRFKELNEKAQRATDLQKQIDDAEEKRLKDAGKWEDVAKSKDEQLTQMQAAVVNAEIKAQAATLGAVNPAIVAQAINRASVTFNKDGTISGVAEAVEALKESDPYLFNNTNGNPTPPRVGSPSNPSNPTNNGYKFTMSQIRNPTFYREHASEIKLAVAQGQVDKDN